MNQKNTDGVRHCAFGGAATCAIFCATVFLGVGAVSHAAPPIEIPGTKTSIKFGGWIKLTYIHDTKARSEDFISYNAIPLDGTPNAERTGHTRLHARESRFNMMTLTPYDGGRKIKTFLEFDFFGGSGGPDEFASAEQRVGNSHSPRLRHAYGELTFGEHKWLFGQTWTNFMHPALITDRVDFSSPPGSHFIRQAQIRYTFASKGGSEYSVALENPESELNGDGISGGPPFNPDQENDKVPDVTARWQTKGKWGLMYVSAVLRQHSLDDRDPANTVKETATAGGIGFGLRAKVFGKDIVRLQLAGGDGMGRYIKELDGQGATFNAATGKLEATPVVGGIIGYTRSWNPRWRSNLIYGYAEVDNESIASVAGANEQLTSSHINTFYSPFKNVDLGLEYAYGKREVENGQEGEVGRISFGAKIRF